MPDKCDLYKTCRVRSNSKTLPEGQGQYASIRNRVEDCYTLEMEIRTLLKQNVSVRAIAKTLGIPRTTMMNRIKRIRKADATPIDDDDIAALWERAMNFVRDQNDRATD